MRSRLGTAHFLTSILGVALAGALFLVGCAVLPVPARVVYEDPTDFVRLEPDPDVYPDLPETLHNHPAKLSVDAVIELLEGLYVRESRNRLQRYFMGVAPLEPAFRDDEIAWLAPRVAEALAEARPDEQVTFYISYPQTSIKREITSGGLYVHGPRLHFRLANHRIIYGIPAYGLVYDRRYPTSPTAPKGFDLFFDPAAAVIEEQTSWWKYLTGRAKDELVLDLQKVTSPKIAI
ncbi:MAG TPA: hypothetical protein VHQ67_06780 [Nitrospiraceae bacterium]|nr:hypothetical protein [Nitrospiraceae bacterium]